MLALGSAFNLTGAFNEIFCLASARTEGEGVGVGDGEVEDVELAVGTGAGSSFFGSDGIGLRVGVGSSLGDSEGDGVGSTDVVGSGEADIDGVEISGAGEFSSASVGATLANINATATRNTKRKTNLPLRVARRSLRSGAICGNTRE